MDRELQEEQNFGRDYSMITIFAAVTVSFIFAIIVSIYSLATLARENTKEIDTMLTYRIYDTISSSLNEPIVVSSAEGEFQYIPAKEALAQF